MLAQKKPDKNIRHSDQTLWWVKPCINKNRTLPEQRLRWEKDQNALLHGIPLTVNRQLN
jgi:hypothetical protein